MDHWYCCVLLSDVKYDIKVAQSLKKGTIATKAHGHNNESWKKQAALYVVALLFILRSNKIMRDDGIMWYAQFTYLSFA
jgi:hypothetical protein